MQTFALFGSKYFRFFEIYGVSARTGGEGVNSVRTFCGQGERGQFFAILCRRLLWTAPYVTHIIWDFVIGTGKYDGRLDDFLVRITVTNCS